VRAVVFHEFGGADVLQLEDLPLPGPGPGEVLLDILACALNHLDVDVREGVSRFPVEPPFVLGVEVVGRIAEVGDGVEGWQVGDRVMPFLMATCGDCRFCRSGPRVALHERGFISFSTSGGYAEQLVCSTRHLMRVPDELTDDQAAAVQIAFGTAWHMLFERGRPRAGETVMINSVGSGIGSAAVQLAHLAARTVIGNASSDDKLARAAELGMDHGINHETQDVVAEVMRLTNDRGVDLVYEHVGGKLFQAGLDSLGKDGRLVICGGHSGEGRPVRHHPVLQDAAERDRVVHLHARRGRDVPRAGTARQDRAARLQDLPARRSARGDADDGAARALRKDRAQAVKRLGVDVGGTFTDLIYVDDEAGTVLVHKIPTTPDDPSEGTVRGIKEATAQAGETPAALDQVFHGTTIATNIVIEHNGAQVGLITTEGYRDILHIARHKKPLNFSSYQDLPWQRYPIVRRRYRLTVPERITRDGSVLVPLDEGRAASRCGS
jgi:NADPH:quinone reductase-like Zn-dependent oxidoreductase